MVKRNKRNIYFSALQCQAVDILKSKKRGNIGVFLCQKGVPYSVSYCNSLVRLYKLVEQHKTIAILWSKNRSCNEYYEGCGRNM